MMTCLSDRAAVDSRRGASVENTLGLNCTAAALWPVRGAADLLAAGAFARAEGLRLLPLGAGSNLVLPSALDAVVLRAVNDELAILRDDATSTILRVGAARPWHELVLWTLDQGLFGLENLALIPGTTGAAPVQNIGAYGRELAEFVVAVHGLELDSGRALVLDNVACTFAYRDSVFKAALRDRVLITAVDLRLSRVAVPVVHYPALAARMEEGGFARSPRGVCDAVIALRRERLPDPLEHPNAGSFFKNPYLTPQHGARLAARYPDLPLHKTDNGDYKASAAWLIDRAGLRGLRMGGVRVSPRHALVIENIGGGSCDEVLALACRVRDAVYQDFDLVLEPEPQILAADGAAIGLP